jgi:uncharacterized Fe-S cluster protein YjdI
VVYEERYAAMSREHLDVSSHTLSLQRFCVKGNAKTFENKKNRETRKRPNWPVQNAKK